ncbi:hypothetical protein LLG46_02985 [bacterium]|nr:hypothetical protein [bacterium]
MRSMLLVFICIMLFISTNGASPASERAIITDPNPDGKITAKMYAQTDTRLSQTVSYEAELKTVQSIVEDLREMTGVNLFAGARKSDWPVRSRKMNIFVKDVPLCDLMDSMARAMKFRWSRSDDDLMIYRLKVNTKAAKQADEMMSEAYKKQEQLWQKRRQQWTDAIDKYGDISTAEQISLRETDPQIYEQVMLGSLQAIHALFEEVPETKERFLTGRNFRIRASDVSPETKSLFYNAGNEFWKHLQRIGYVGEKTQNPTGYGPKAVQPYDDFDIVYMRMDAGMFTPNLHWGGASSDTGYWHLYRNKFTYVNSDFEINGLRYLGSEVNKLISLDNIRINEGRDTSGVDDSEENTKWETAYEARSEENNKLEESLYPSEPLIEHESSPFLEQVFKLEIEQPKPDANPMLALAEKIASFQKALFDASGISIVSDCWLSIPYANLSVSDSKVKLDDLLNSLCTTFNYNWDKPESIIEFRYRKWAKMRLTQIPEEWVETWSNNTRANGYLSLNDIAQIANLDYYQAEESIKQDPVIGIMGTYSKMLRKLDDNLTWLRLYASLNQQMRNVLAGDHGLFGQMLTSAQWKIAQPMFDRIGITRGDAWMQMYTVVDKQDPQFITIWFREMDMDTKQMDRMYKLILPSYTPQQTIVKTTADK